MAPYQTITAPPSFDQLDPKPRSYNPKVSLDPNVYYKTQQSTYERIECGVGKSPRKGQPKPKARTGPNRAERRQAKQIAYSLLDLVDLGPE